MNQVADVMTRDVHVVAPTDTIRQAARTMDDLDVGAVPVCEGTKLVGIVTDRDLALRAVALGKPPDSTPVSQVMSADLRWCYDDQAVEEVMEEMSGWQIRRVPVLDREKRLVGIVSLGDMAERGGADADAGEALKDISTPSKPDR